MTLKEVFLVMVMLDACRCTSCDDKNIQISQLQMQVEELRRTNEQLEKTSAQIRKDYVFCQEQSRNQSTSLADCKAKLGVVNTHDEMTLNYFRNRAAQRVALQTSLQRDRVKKMSLLFEKYSGGNPLLASYLEDVIYKTIQSDHSRWVQAFGYEPINRQQQIVNPAKSVLLYQGLAMQMLKTNGLLSEDQLIRYLDAVFGDDTGRIIAKIPANELAALAD